ncbi:MAG: hypothetical protein SF069_08770 [Phycisphaerae bacterium]|nr:hypothetical protein [Phycisphaerae bacterium]
MLSADPAYSIPQIMFFANAAGYRYLAKLASWLADWASAPEHRKHVDSFTMGRGREIELADDSDEILLRFIVAGRRATKTARAAWHISHETAK